MKPDGNIGRALRSEAVPAEIRSLKMFRRIAFRRPQVPEEMPATFKSA